MIPFRLRVLRALCDRLVGIQYVDEKGHSIEIGANVFRGRVVFGDDDPLPMLSLLESPMQPQGSFPGPGGRRVKQTWELVLQGFVKNDPKNPTDPAHFLLGEVKQRLIEIRGEKDPTTGQLDLLGFGGALDDITFDPGVVRPPDETSSVAHFWLTLYLELVEDLSQPYA